MDRRVKPGDDGGDGGAAHHGAGMLSPTIIGTHAEYDRIDPETVTWRRK